MKKNLLLGLLTLSTLWLAACGTKHYEMSFEDAVNASNNRNQELANLLLNSDYIEQSFNLSSSESENDSSIDINVNSNTKKAIGQMLSEWVLNLALNLKWATNANINWTIETKSVDNNLYLNLSSLEISGDENLASLGSLWDGFKNQRFNIPLSWSFKMIATVKDYLKDLGETRDQNLELYVNEWQETYNGKFTDYNWYNAWKFTLDTDKIKELMQEYYALLISEWEEIPETSIESFEGYLVITDKDEVTTIIENMIIIANDLSISFNSIYGDGIYEINASSQWQDIMSISVKRNKNTYNIICSSPDLIEITWTATPKLDSSKINIDYDLSMVIVADIETKATTSLPLKGSRSLAKIDNFNVEAPADAIDLLK